MSLGTALITAATDAATSVEINIGSDLAGPNDPPSAINVSELSLFAHGLAGVETAKIQIKNYAGAWSDLYIGGSIAQMTATNNSLSNVLPCVCRVVKSSTASAAGVTIFI